jgi:hypothetical protein
LKELVKETDERRTTVVYQLFDNVCYQVKKADGSKALPGEHGHATAESGWTVQKDNYHTHIEIHPCCGAKDHCTNVKDRNYKQWMEGRLLEICGVVEDYVRMSSVPRS